ncbi:MAG: TrpR YerC/YecD [Oscillospiraceae bacterium]|jgi:TrpR-related protein YerC/YecD|nr:TrpR YerC/YecD [Oscillospiraceae bacterium]
MKHLTDKKYQEFFKAILTLENNEECRKFFEDVCTFKEMDAIVQRYMVAVMLNDKKSYTQINESTGASSATISRVVRSLENSEDGYKIVFERLKKTDSN